MQRHLQLTTTLIDDEQLLAARPDVNYMALTVQPSPQDFLVLTRVKGVTSVGQLCKTSGLGRDKTLAAIDVLLRAGLLEEVDADGKPIRKAAPAPAPAPAAPVPTVHETAAPDEATSVLSPTAAAAALFGAPPADARTSVMSGQEAAAIASMIATSEEPEEEVIALGAPSEAQDDLFGGGEPLALEGHSYSSAPAQPFVPPASARPIVIEPDDAPGPSSFQPVVPVPDDDDLFEPESPAHIARVEGRAPLKRDHDKVKVAEAQPAAQQAAKARPVVESASGAYARFPVKFAGYESPYPVAGSIEPELQREVDFVYDHLAYVDFYQLFGVETTADRKEIRAAYFEMSKRFHPDKFFRDEVGDLAERVDAVFKFVTKGYQTLSKKDKRDEYDEALARAREQAQDAESEEDRKREAAAELLERRATQLEEQGQLAAAAAELKKVGSLRRDPYAFVRAANLLLRANQRLDEAASLARAAVRALPAEVGPRLTLGQIYEKNQMFAEAAQAYAEAEGLAPGDPSIRVHLERVRAQL